MAEEKYQLVPFPIPDHLMSYFSSKLGCELETLNTTSKCTLEVINKHSFYGQKIHNNLKEATYHKTPTSNFYLKISNYIKTNHSNAPDGRYVMYQIEDDALLFIKKHLQQILKSELLAFVEGALFSYERLKGTKKGITHKAIERFMIKNNITITETSFENLRKLHYRSKNSAKKLIIS